MTFLTPIKRLVKSNGLLHAHAAALRSRRPLSNVVNVGRNRLFAKTISRTLVSYDRLLNTYELAVRVERERLPGAFVECGVWRGGIGGLLGLVAQGSGRETHLFDSFEGLPVPTAEDGERGVQTGLTDLNGTLQPIGLYAASTDDVSHFLYRELKLAPEKVVLHKGWFQDTLIKANDDIKAISILRIDADWYESVKVCLECLYENTVEGGYVILDDYGTYPGCKKAFHDFASSIRLEVELHPIDVNGVWFKKPYKHAQPASR